MSPIRRADPDLDDLIDDLIDDITIDCHDEYEQLTGFQTAFENDDAFPLTATVVGEPIEVLAVHAEDDRHALIATCRRHGREYEIALLDINITADPKTSRLIAAYRRWMGT